MEESDFEGALRTGEMVDQHINLLIGNFTYLSLMVIIEKTFIRNKVGNVDI